MGEFNADTAEQLKALMGWASDEEAIYKYELPPA